MLLLELREAGAAAVCRRPLLDLSRHEWTNFNGHGVEAVTLIKTKRQVNPQQLL
jgi:hypothetical protein